MNRITFRPVGLLALIALACAVGCGGEEAGPTGATANAAPEIEQLRLTPEDPVSGDRVTADARVRDRDGDPVEVVYEWTVGGVPQGTSAPELRLGEVRKGTVVEVSAVASDGLRSSDPRRASVTVRNRRPRLDVVRIEPWEKVAPGQTLSVSAEATDPDGDALEYQFSWRVNGREITTAGDSFSTAALQPGDLVVARARALDGEDASDPIDSAPVRVVGANPEIVSSPGGWSGTGTFEYRVEVVHPDGDRNLRFSLKSGPEGMEVDPIAGEVRWTPAAGQLGDFTVAVAVEDSRGAVTVQEFDLSVNGASAPAAIAP